MSVRKALVISQLGYGGAERQLTLLAGELVRRGEELLVICLSESLEPHGDQLLAADVPLEAIRRGGHLELGRAVRLARLLEERRIGLVHSFLEGANSYTHLARHLAGPVPFVASVRNLAHHLDPLRKSVHRRALLKADAILANSAAVADSYAGEYRIARERFTVVRNGVLLPPPVDERARRAARVRFRLPSERRVIGTIAKDTANKNVVAFLRLGTRLADRWGPVCALAAGPGLDERFAATRAVERTAACHAVLLGPVRDPQPFYAALDLFVLTSLSEGLPNVVLEAMAAGLPVVAYAVGGVPELVEEGRTGLLVEPGDEDGLLEAVARLLADPGLAGRLGAAGRERAAGEFSVERMAGATLELHRRVLERRAPAGADYSI